MSGQPGQEAEASAAQADISYEIKREGWREERRTFKECIFHVNGSGRLQPSNPLYLIHCWNMSICLRKLPLPEIFYNNNDFELIDNLSDREEERPENQGDHER